MVRESYSCKVIYGPLSGDVIDGLQFNPCGTNVSLNEVGILDEHMLCQKTQRIFHHVSDHSEISFHFAEIVGIQISLLQVEPSFAYIFEGRFYYLLDQQRPAVENPSNARKLVISCLHSNRIKERLYNTSFNLNLKRGLAQLKFKIWKTLQLCFNSMRYLVRS